MRKFIFILFLFPFLMKGQSIVAGDTISANIYYKNIKDTLLGFLYNGTTYFDMDLDEDNNKDIKFAFSMSGSSAASQTASKVFSLSNLEFVVPALSTYADTIPLDSVIDKTLNWKNIATGPLLRYTYSQNIPPPPIINDNGQFKRKNNYLGFRKSYPTDTLYGWVLLDMTSRVKVKSYAIEKKCNVFPAIMTISSSSIICSGESATLTASGVNSYSWSTNESTSSILVTPGVSTTYTVQGSTGFGCIKTAIITQSVDACVGIEELELKKIKIYPNPVSDNLNMQTGEREFSNSEIEIVNYLGQAVLKTEFKNQIDVSKFTDGIYTLKLITKDNQYYYSKFVKE